LPQFVGRLCSARNRRKSVGPKPQQFAQRRAQPWCVGRTACYVVWCLSVFSPTGQAFASKSRGIENELLARWAGRYRDEEGTLVGPLCQGCALRWANGHPFGARIRRLQARNRNRLRTGRGTSWGLSQFSVHENGTVPLGTREAIPRPILSSSMGADRLFRSPNAVCRIPKTHSCGVPGRQGKMAALA
jgi:hypothetical protein